MRDPKQLDKVLKEIAAIFDREKITPDEAIAITKALDTLNDNRIKG